MAFLIACATSSPLRFPSSDGPHAPSALVVRGEPERLADVSRCAACHPEAAAGWSTSAHAHASFDNPWYRSSVESLREEVGRSASRHCAGCHDPVLLAKGKMDGPVDSEDPDARLGVTCLSCHGAVQVATDGNASLVLDLADIPFPDAHERSGERVDAHRTRMRPAVLDDVCGACHRGFLDARTGNAAFVTGLDDLGSHAASAAGGSRARRVEPTSVPEASCVDCHFDGHRFPGGQTALATQTGQLAAVRARLDEAVALYAVAQLQGDDLVVDAIVHNVGTGHVFPGGLGDAQDTWIELRVDGPAGVSLAEVARPEDPRAHHIRAEVLDESGRPERRHRAHRIGLVAWDHRVDPGDARVFRTIVEDAGEATGVHLALHHRPHPRALQRAAQQVASKELGSPPDTVLARADAPVGAPRAFDVARAHGLGLLHQVSEHLAEARHALELALELAPDERSRASVLALRGRLFARTLETAAALEDFDAAARLVGGHPALSRGRAEALALGWRWEEAAAEFAQLAVEAPRDVATWRDLAQARLAAVDYRGALRATDEGLRRAPRDPDLLRIQALAAAGQGHPDAAEAWLVWEQFRPRDDLADRRRACDEHVPGCAEARLPVPQLRLSRR